MDSLDRSTDLPPLVIEASRDASTYTVRLNGELDLANCDELNSVLERVEASDAERLIVDLARLAFIDSTGLRVLLEAARRGANDGDRIRFTRGNGRVAEIFRLSGFDKVLPFV